MHSQCLGVIIYVQRMYCNTPTKSLPASEASKPEKESDMSSWGTQRRDYRFLHMLALRSKQGLDLQLLTTGSLINPEAIKT